MACVNGQPHDGTVDGCFGCKIRTINVDPYAMPSRLHHGPKYMKKAPENSWEKGIARDDRGMPILKSDGSRMGVKEFGEKRSKLYQDKKAKQATAHSA